MSEAVRIGIVTVSDRASRGEYQDQGGPAIAEWLKLALATPWQPVIRLVPDEQSEIARVLRELCDRERCCLVITTGGTMTAAQSALTRAGARSLISLAIAHG